MAYNEKKALLQITGLVKWFPIKKWFFEKKEYVKAVDDVEFEVYEGETSASPASQAAVKAPS